MKKNISLFIVAVMIVTAIACTIMPLQTNAATATTSVKRYTVLVLDTSGTVTFTNNGKQIYEANPALENVKKAAKHFMTSLESADGDNYVAVVSFQETATVVSDFSKDMSTTGDKIDNLSSGGTSNISAGLEAAENLINNIDDEGAIKNVVLCTTGLTWSGNHSYEGKYDENVEGSNWLNLNTNIHLYAYANYAMQVADRVKDKANLYVLGLFQTMSEMPEEGSAVVNLFRLTAKDIASSEGYFYDIVDIDNIQFKFGEVADAITDKDTDGDGLPDSWELYGVDTDFDGVVDLRLDLMGADPNVPDIFVEIDWMTMPKKTILFITTQQEQSLAPSADAMHMVYEAFKKQGINLHIDVGPSSIDYVTGKQWGALSGGNEIAYVELLNLSGSERGTWAGWQEYANSHFNVNRRNVFKYCMFINQFEYDYYDNVEDKWKTSKKTISGVAESIPGQYFIVANQKWLRDTGDLGVAGTFMHELGHTLGLSHGGFDDEGNNNHDSYKPNYISIMNYLFQTSGLSGTGEINYSEYDLPDLDENALSEQLGIDPYGVTAGTGLGTKFSGAGWFGKDKEFVPIANKGIDFDGWWGVEDKIVSVDLNNDEKLTVLTSSTDWDHLIFAGGDIGSKKQVIYINGIASQDTSLYSDELLTLEEALANNSLAQSGTIALEALGPYNLFTGHTSQNIYVRILNMSSVETVVNLTIDASNVTDEQVVEITVPASIDSISYVDVKIPIVRTTVEGEYLVHVTGTTEQGKVNDIYCPISIQTVTEDELNELYEAIFALDGELPYTLLTEYENALEDCAIKGHVGGEWIIDKNAEIGVAGEKHISCVNCGEVIETVTIDPLPNKNESEPNYDTGSDIMDFIDSIADEIGITSNQLLIIAGCSLIVIIILSIVVVVVSLVALIALIIVITKIKRKRR